MTRHAEPPRHPGRSRRSSPPLPPPHSESASVASLVRRHLLRSKAGKLCVIGAVLQLPIAVFLVVQAFARFPGRLSETLASLAFMHVCVVAALFGCWICYGILLNFRNNMLQNALLVLIALSPFFPTTITLVLA